MPLVQAEHVAPEALLLLVLLRPCLTASALRRRVGIRAGRRAADFEGRNDGFRDAAAEMEVARDNAKELFLLTLPSLHCHLQKAWLPKGSERESLRALPLRVYSLAGLVQKVRWG